MSEVTAASPKETAKWYILHTYSGYENKVANNIKTFIDNNEKLKPLFEDILNPTQIITEQTSKKQKDGTSKPIVKEKELKLFPCYVYVKMVMTDETWYVCRNTRGVTGFVGPGSKPIALTDEEVQNLGMTKIAQPKAFDIGDNVKIKSGVLEGFEGKLLEFNEEARTAIVSVTMFGRETQSEVAIDDIKIAD